MKVDSNFAEHAEGIRRQAAQSLFDLFESSCEGAIAVDTAARIVWINEEYAAFLGLKGVEEALGREIEEVIPNSLMREVVRTGEPILLDIMEFKDQPLVVIRFPLR